MDIQGVYFDNLIEDMHKNRKFYFHYGALPTARAWFALSAKSSLIAKDYQKKPDDFVVATGEQHSVREFCKCAFAEAGIEIEFKGEGVNEKGYDAKTGRLLVDVNPEFYRPAEVEFLWGDATKAETELGWKRKVDFKGLVAMMMGPFGTALFPKEVFGLFERFSTFSAVVFNAVLGVCLMKGRFK